MHTIEEHTSPANQTPTIGRAIRRPDRKIQFAYPGGKSRIAPWLVQMMPRSGRLYLEPFAGRGNVYFTAANHLKFERWWLNDISTAPFFQALKQTNGMIEVPPRSREHYTLYKELFRAGNADAILLEPYFTHSGGGYRNGGFATGHGPTQEGYRRTLIDAAHNLHLHKVKITAHDWELLDLDEMDEDDFIYVDAPYLRGDVRAYKATLDHEKLVQRLKRARCKWMLSEYPIQP